MNKNTIKLSVFALLFATGVATAQQNLEQEVEQLDEVVLSDSKFELKKENSGKIIYKITQKDIERSAGKTVVELLDFVAGVEIKGSNQAQGSILGTFFRGGRNHQVAVVIDGVIVSDPSGINNSYNLSLLDISQIESIEILKGASSTLYGSSAATGVINITLKKASKSILTANYVGSIGTSDTQNNRENKLDEHNHSLGLRGTSHGLTYVANIGYSKTDGISSLSDIDAEETYESDGFESLNTLFKLGYNVTDNLSVELFTNYSKVDYDYDYFGADTDDDVTENEQVQFGIKSNFKYAKGKLIATFSKTNLDRIYKNTTTLSESIYTGRSTFLDIVNKYDFSEQLHLITGLDYQEYDNEETTPYGSIDRDLSRYNTFDPYVSAIYTGRKFNLNIGARLNNHSEYGSHLVGHINPSFNISNTEDFKFKVLTSLSSAFIAPSTYQLFSTYSGNINLNPEEDVTFEFGFDTSVEKWFQASAVFFYREEDNKIIYVTTDFVTYAGEYQNALAVQNSKGLEASVQLKSLDSRIRLNLTHTYTHKSEDFLYIPENKFTAGLSVIPFENTYVTINFKHVGDRAYAYGDQDYIDAYNLLDLSASYKWDYVTVFAALNNVSNKEYVESLGYSTKGRNLKVGVKLNF